MFMLFFSYSQSEWGPGVNPKKRKSHKNIITLVYTTCALDSVFDTIWKLCVRKRNVGRYTENTAREP